MQLEDIAWFLSSEASVQQAKKNLICVTWNEDCAKTSYDLAILLQQFNKS